MKVFFSSDTHYFHENIIRYCSRPFSDSAEMNKGMVERWNSVVGPHDFAIHVGDVSAGLKGRMNELREIVRSLNGRKFLVRGNHDHLADEWYLESGFEKVVHNVNLGGVLFIHYPLHEAFARGISSDDLGVVEHVVHGHTHAVDVPEHDNHFNVAVERNGFTPVASTAAIPQELHEKFINAFETWTK